MFGGNSSYNSERKHIDRLPVFYSFIQLGHLYNVHVIQKSCQYLLFCTVNCLSHCEIEIRVSRKISKCENQV